MDIFIALLTTHAWAASLRFTMASKLTYNMAFMIISKNQSLEYKGRERWEAGFKTHTYIKYQENTLLS